MSSPNVQPLTLFLYTQGSCTSAKPVCNLLIKWLNKELASLQCCKLIWVTCWRLADAITVLMVLPLLTLRRAILPLGLGNSKVTLLSSRWALPPRDLNTVKEASHTANTRSCPSGFSWRSNSRHPEVSSPWFCMANLVSTASGSERSPGIHTRTLFNLLSFASSTVLLETRDPQQERFLEQTLWASSTKSGRHRLFWKHPDPNQTDL